MDKYEFNIKVEQIKKLVGKNDYETAMKIADTIDWRRVRNTNLLSMVAMVYEKNEDYQEAKEILLQAFERAPIGKRLLYKLAELAIKEGNIEEAETYYKEFGDLASEDPRQQLLRYMILKAKGAPAQQLIHSLEAYTSVELDEKWLYELAELYSLAGSPDRCVETCDRIMLMFGLGKYVDKAMDLKVQYAPLTNYQMDLIENRDKYEARLRAVEQEFGTGKTGETRNSQEDYAEGDQESDVSYQNVPVEEHLEASIEEAAVQESLAMEVSKISYEEPVMEEESQIEHTRVLEDIRRFGRPSAAISAAASIYAAESARPHLFASEPVIEEEEPEGPGMEENSLNSYEIEGNPYPVNINGYEDSTEVNSDYTDFNYESQTDTEKAGEFCDHVEEEISWNYESAAEDADDVMEVEDLFEDEEEDSEKVPVRNHLMIEAKTSEMGLKIAIEALKQIHKENGVNNPVAKISGSKLSQRSILSCAEKLAAKDLIIEDAGDLSQESLHELNELMDRDTSGMIVVLIDTPQQMETLHREHTLLASKFECIGSSKETLLSQPYYDEYDEAQETLPEDKSWGPADHSSNNYLPDNFPEEESYEDDFYEDETELEERRSVRNEEGPGSHGEEMELDEFAQYACRYANEIDCSITGKSMLALYERIEIMEEDGVPLNRTNAETLIEEAADRAEKPSFGKKIKNLFTNKYDKDGLLVLKEEHFIY